MITGIEALEDRNPPPRLPAEPAYRQFSISTCRNDKNSEMGRVS